MSGLLIPCPQCSSGLRLKDRSKLGKLGKCPKCGHKFVLHEPEEVELELDTEGPAFGTGAQWVPETPAPFPGLPSPGPFPGPPPSFPQAFQPEFQPEPPPVFPSFDEPAEAAAGPVAGPVIDLGISDQPRTPARPLVPQFEKGTPLAEVLRQLGKPAKRKVIAAPVPAGNGANSGASNGAKAAPQPARKREYLLFEHPAGPYKLVFVDGQIAEVHSQPDAAALPPVPAAAPVGGRVRVSRRKKSQRNLGIALSGLAALAIMGVVIFASSRKPRPEPAPVVKKPPQKSQTYEDEKENLAMRFDAARDLAAQVVPPAGPVPMRMAPAGAAAVFHLHPATLWSDQPRFQEVRATIDPLVKWAEAEIERITGFPPRQIDELSVYLLLPGRGAPPDYSAVVRLSQPLQSKSIFIDKFLGQMQPGTGYTRFDAPTRSYILHDDLQTFAVGPPLYVDEIIGTMHTDQGAARPGVDELRIHTDRARHFTMLFNRADVMLYDKGGLVGESVQPLVDRAMAWLGDDVESASWSFHVGERQFLSEFQFRVGHDWLPQELTKKMQKKLDRLPNELLAAARKMQPTQVGYRKVIGRFPAMMKLYSLKTIGGSGNRFAQLTTVLEERAAPNLMLGALLTWDESTRTDFDQAAPTPPTADPKLPDTIAGRLKLPIDAEFNRTPLQEAIDLIAEGTKLTIDINGDALKFAGYTKNMPQTFNLGKVPAEQAIAKILSQYEHMCVVVRSEPEKKIEVMTYDFAKKEGLEPLKFPKPK